MIWENRSIQTKSPPPPILNSTPPLYLVQIFDISESLTSEP